MAQQSFSKWCLHHALPIWFEIFNKNCAKTQIWGSICETSSLSKSLLASCKSRDGVMLHEIVTTKHHLGNLKFSYTIHKLWWIVVRPKLTKIINNSKLFKIFWNLHLWHLCVNYCPLKIINVWRNNLSLQIKSESWCTMWVDHVYQPQLATCGPLINLALFKWTKIWHKGAESHAKWCLHPCPTNLV